MNDNMSNFISSSEHFVLSHPQTYLLVPDKSRDAAANLASRFLIRHDVKQELLPQALQWMMQILKDADCKNGFIVSVILYIYVSHFFLLYLSCMRLSLCRELYE